MIRHRFTIIALIENQLQLLDFELIRFSVCITMLSLASFYDLKKREVSDRLWIVFGIAATLLLLLEWNNESRIQNIVISLIFSAPLSLLFWKKGLFGGADSFAIILISALAPFSFGGNYYPTTSLTNSLLLLLSVFIFNFFRNMKKMLEKEDIFEGFKETTGRKTLAMFMGVKTNSKFGFSIEQKFKNGKKFNFSLKNCETSKFSTRKEWCSPGIPFILFITGGFIIQIFFGDLFLSLFN